MNNLIEVGKISRSFGLDGAFKIISSLDDDSQFDNFTKLIVFGSSEYRNIERLWFKKNNIYIKLEGIDSIDEVEKLVGFSVYVDEDEFDSSLNENQFLIDSLIGSDVFIDNNKIGTVKDVINGPSQDILVVANGEEEAMVPFVKDIVKNVDVELRQIHILLIEGMIPWI